MAATIVIRVAVERWVTGSETAKKTVEMDVDVMTAAPVTLVSSRHAVSSSRRRHFQ